MNFFDESVDFFDRVQRTSFYRKKLLRFIDFIASKPYMLSLDVGCGPGALVRELAAKTKYVIGIDSSKAMVKRARENARLLKIKNVEFGYGEAENIPYPEKYFDLVVATSVLYLLQEPSKGIKEMVRVVKLEGIVALTDPSKRMSSERVKRYAKLHGLDDFDLEAIQGWAEAAESNHRFSRGEMERLLQGHGLGNMGFAYTMDGMVILSKGMKKG